jgi:hypothetical protein
MRARQGNAMSLTKAFQVEVKSSTSSGRQVFFVEAESETAALQVVSQQPGLLPDPKLRLERRLSDTEIDMHQIGPGSVVQWL